MELPYRCIQLYTFEGDVVLDPFMGSGQTAIAALKTGRHYVGYEVDRDYVTPQRAEDQRFRWACGRWDGLVLGCLDGLGHDLGEELLERPSGLELLGEEALVRYALLAGALHAAEDRREPLRRPRDEDEALLGLVFSDGPDAGVQVDDVQLARSAGRRN